MTEQEVKLLGYKLVKEYDHDRWHTKRYAKGHIEIELTYDGDNLECTTLSISDYVSNLCNSDIKVLDAIVNRSTGEPF